MLRFYYRYSPRPDETGPASLRRQSEACWVHAKTKHADKTSKKTCVRCYTDENISGGTFQRPALQAMLSELRQGDIVIAASHDRLARDMGVFASIRQAVAGAGATIEYADGTTPEDTPEGRLVSGIFALFAEYERDRTRTRTKKAMAKKKAAGKRVSGNIPIGWQELEIDGEIKLFQYWPELLAVIEACRLRSLGFTWVQVCTNLNTNSAYARRDNKPWTITCIRKAVKKNFSWARPSYAGEPSPNMRVPSTPYFNDDE